MLLPTDVNYILKNNLIKAPRTSLAFTTGVQVLSYVLYGRADVCYIIFEMPSFNAVVTGVLTIENKDGTTVYASSSSAESTIHLLAPDVPVPIIGKTTIKITLNTDPTSSGTCYVTPYLKGDD